MIKGKGYVIFQWINVRSVATIMDVSLAKPDHLFSLFLGVFPTPKKESVLAT